MSHFGQSADYENINSITPIESLYPDLAQNSVSNATADELNPEPALSTRIIYWYHPDYVGNVDLITDLNQEAYEFYLNNPWGESLYHWESGSSSWNSPYRFNSKEFDAETGMYYYGARYYDPKVSVWLSVDPLVEKFPELTAYCFTSNNPIMFVDPDGKEPVTWRERIWAAFNYKAAKRIKANVPKANSFAKQSGLPHARDGGQDAFRHGTWSALNARDVGENKAREFVTLHEEANNPELDPVATQMDNHNNEVGIAIGRANPEATDQEIVEKVEAAYELGMMVKISRDSNGDYLDAQGNIIDRSIEGWKEQKVIVPSNTPVPQAKPKVKAPETTYY